LPFTTDPEVGNSDILGFQPVVHFKPSETISINETRQGHWFHPGKHNRHPE